MADSSSLHQGSPPAWLAKALGDFSFEAYLTWYGRISLNMEDDGGIYLIHSSINHNCNPSAKVKRVASYTSPRQYGPDARPSRIFIFADRDMTPGEEITVTYVDPTQTVSSRRTILQAEYLFQCHCAKCDEERLTVHRLNSIMGGTDFFNSSGQQYQIFHLGDKGGGSGDITEELRKLLNNSSVSDTAPEQIESEGGTITQIEEKIVEGGASEEAVAA